MSKTTTQTKKPKQQTEGTARIAQERPDFDKLLKELAPFLPTFEPKTHVQIGTWQETSTLIGVHSMKTK